MLKKFKPAKCKTALNLAKSRIKLLKNKKDSQVKQLRREVAQLLESGQDQTARIRVENVVREEKTMAAFELIEIYCELVVARLPIVETQKNCPLDLKEAITSLIFAAPRCADIPELQDVHKHFTTKYGKEFVAAATELRPDCGVSRNLVEKLSVKAPDGPTKVKILTAIAEEHNIKWEPRWFKDEDAMPSIDMPKEQRMEKAGVIQMEPLNFVIGDNLQESHASKTSSQTNSHVSIDANVILPSSTSHLNRKAVGRNSDRNPFSQSSGIAPENAFEGGRPKWTMEFKNATAAAQAAAEAAEQASMAARAAAELSRHANSVNDTSSRPLASAGHDSNEGKIVYDGIFKLVDKDSSDISFNQRSSRMQVDRVGGYEQGNTTKATESRSSDEDFFEAGVQYGGRKEYYREIEDSRNPVYQEERQSRDSLPSFQEAGYDVFESLKHQDYGNVHDASVHEGSVNLKIEPGIFESQSSAFGDEYGIFSNLNDKNKKNSSDAEYYGGSDQRTANYDGWQVKPTYDSGIYESSGASNFTDRRERDGIFGLADQKYGFDSSEAIFTSTDHKTNVIDDIKGAGTNTDTTAVFDDYSSDDDEDAFDPAEKSYDLPSLGKSSPKHIPFHHQVNQSSFSSRPHNRLEVSESFRNSSLYAKLSEPLDVKFDSDGESSESEKEPENERTRRVILSNDDGKHLINPDATIEQEEWQCISSDATVKHKFDVGDLYARQSSYERTKSRQESHDVVHEAKPQKLSPTSRFSSQESDPVPELENETETGTEGGMELNFRLLPGGLRNRRQWDPPYRRGTDASSSPRSSRADADGAISFQVSSSQVGSTEASKKSSEYTHLESNFDGPEVLITEKSSTDTERPYSLTINETSNRSREDPTGCFYSNDSIPEDDTLKQSTMSRTLLGAGLSRRTKGSAPRSVANSLPSATGDPIPDSSSSTAEVSRKLEPETSGPRPTTKVTEDEYNSPSSATGEQMTPNDTEISSASSSNKKAPPSRENSTQKPGHVHPKLPDIETFTAHFHSLRKNRQN